MIKITVLDKNSVVLEETKLHEECYHPLVPRTVASITEKLLEKYQGRWIEVRTQVI
jgi:hypothetical protein